MLQSGASALSALVWRVSSVAFAGRIGRGDDDGEAVWVTLTTEERGELERMISRGKADARKLAHARILLQADEAEGGPAWVDGTIAGDAERERPHDRAGAPAVRRAGAERGAAAQAPERIYTRKLDGEREARLIALACSRPPAGEARWTLRLLAERMVELEHVDHALARDGAADAQKNELKPHLKKMWCIPPKQSAEFVCHMEDVLDVYHRPYDPSRPVVCLDETFKQLIGETREPLPASPGQVERYDYVYVRNGMASLFLAFEPLAGWRHVEVTDGRTRVDWARFVRDWSTAATGTPTRSCWSWTSSTPTRRPASTRPSRPRKPGG